MAEKSFFAQVIEVGSGNREAADRMYQGFTVFVSQAAEAASVHPGIDPAPTPVPTPSNQADSGAA